MVIFVIFVKFSPLLGYDITAQIQLVRMIMIYVANVTNKNPIFIKWKK